MLQALERANQSALTEHSGPDRAPGAAELYASAFRAYGLDVANPALGVEEAAAAVRRSAVSRHLIGGLDAWAGRYSDPPPPVVIAAGASEEVRQRMLAFREQLQGQVALRRRLLALAQAADDPETLSSRARQAVLAGDPAALRRLLQGQDLAELPSGSLHLLAGVLPLDPNGEEQLAALLRQSVSRHPDDFLLTYALALNLSIPSATRLARPAEAVGYFRAALALRPAPEDAPAQPETLGLYRSFADALLAAGEAQEALAVTRRVARSDHSPGASWQLARALVANQQWDEAFAEYRKLEGTKSQAVAHRQLREAIRQARRLDEARRLAENEPNNVENHRLVADLAEAMDDLAGKEAAYRKILELLPADWQTRKDLVRLCVRQKRFDDAVAVADTAPAVEPHRADLYVTLGTSFEGQGLFDRAAAAHRKAIELHGDLGLAHAGLCAALTQQGMLDEAVAAGRRAVELAPNDPNAQRNLGRALREKGLLDEALAAHRRTVELAPASGLAYVSLALTLKRKGLPDEAADAFRKAAQLAPNDPTPLVNLGEVLAEGKRHAEAEAAFRDALKREPDHAEALCRLGLALREQGRFADALDALRRGHDLGAKQPTWSPPSEWLKETERMADLDARLPAYLKGERRPADAAELLRVVRFAAEWKGRFKDAAELAAASLTDRPELGDSTAPAAADRPLLAAACAAAQAAAGVGDARDLPPKERARWRQRALDWLKRDLAFWEKQAEAGAGERAQVRAALGSWQTDPALAAVRDPAALEPLPHEERAAWRGLWADVAGLIRRADRP
jgi:tetratricopeptide (TPR) repeat protein